jgi:hypothetical protein
MAIVNSQMKIERNFNMAGIITGLRCCQLGIGNLDKLVFIMKNWLDDPRFGCTTSLQKCLEIEDGMVSKNENLVADFKFFEEN